MTLSAQQIIRAVLYKPNVIKYVDNYITTVGTQEDTRGVITGLLACDWSHI